MVITKILIMNDFEKTRLIKIITWTIILIITLTIWINIFKYIRGM